MKEIQLTQGKVALVDDEAARKYHDEFANLNFKDNENIAPLSATGS